MTKNTNIKEKLQEIVKNQPDSIRSFVAKEWLKNLAEYSPADEGEKSIDYAEQSKEWLNDLITGGCASGFVSSLIYLKDTHAFFIKYYEEIFNLLDEYKNNTGTELVTNGDRANFYAWFGFEQTASDIANELKIDL